MKEDFLQNLGYHSIVARMKRIVEATTHSSRELYKELGLDIEPNWYLIFKLLEKEGALTIVEIAEQLQFSHPTVVMSISKLKKRDYVMRTVDEKDYRRKPIRLTDKAINKLPEYKRIWKAGELALETFFRKNSKILEELSYVESQLKEITYKERIEEFLNKGEDE